MGLIYNSKEIWPGISSGESMYPIENGYAGFFLSGNSGIGDRANFKSIPNVSKIEMTGSIDDCENGIMISASQQGLFQYNDSNYGGTFNPVPPVSPTSILISKDSPSGSITLGRNASSDNTYLLKCTIKASEKLLTFSSSGNYPMGQYDDDMGWTFWAITSIVSY